MIESYYLGANSETGFVSLYGDFAAAPGDMLHVVKGGPGNGKSGLMRRIGQAAEQRGLDVSYVRCSGDPDSLDGVYIPALRQGWMDGTAPHAADPRHFGADGDYVDLGRFCRLPLEKADRERVLRLTEAYRARYAQAYRWLAAAGALRRAAASPGKWAWEERLRRRVRGLLQRQGVKGAGGVTRRFQSAISCRGLLREALPAGYGRVCPLDTARGLAGGALRIAEEEARARGLRRILCLSPLEPTEPEALLLPEAGLAFTAGSFGAPGERWIHLDAMAEPMGAEEKRRLRRAWQMQEAALDSATEALRQAKVLHDELESVYRPYMDFAALDAFTEATLSSLFEG